MSSCSLSSTASQFSPDCFEAIMAYTYAGHMALADGCVVLARETRGGHPTRNFVEFTLQHQVKHAQDRLNDDYFADEEEEEDFDDEDDDEEEEEEEEEEESEEEEQDEQVLEIPAYHHSDDSGEEMGVDRLIQINRLGLGLQMEMLCKDSANFFGFSNEHMHQVIWSGLVQAAREAAPVLGPGAPVYAMTMEDARMEPVSDPTPETRWPWTWLPASLFNTSGSRPWQALANWFSGSHHGQKM